MPTISRPSTVQQAVKAIRRFHDLGLESLRQHPGRMPRGSWQKEADRLRMHKDTFGKARVFADPKRGYSKRELDDLCRLCEKHKTIFGLMTVIKLLTVPKPQRFVIQREAIAGHWSQKRTCAEIKKRLGPRRTVGGQRPIAPLDADHACVQIVDRCAQWRHWCKVISEPGPDSTKKPMFEQLRKALRGRLEEMLKAVEALEKEAARRLPKGGEGD